MRYLICYTPRTGSQALADILRLTSVAGRPSEYFHDHQWELHTEKSPAEFVADVWKRAASKNGVAGVRIHVNQWHDLKSRLGLSSDAELHALMGEPKYILTTRRDKDRQAVSYELARQRQEFSRRKGQSAPDKPVHFDREAIERHKQNHAAMEAGWRGVFAAIGQAPHEVTQEALAADHDATVRGVLDYLGISWPADKPIPQSTLAIQSNEVNEEWLSRFKAGK